MRLLRISCLLALIACGSSSKPAPARPATGDQTATSPAEPAPSAETPPPAPPPPPPPIPEAPAWTPTTPRAHVTRVLPQLPADAMFVAGFDVPRLAKAPVGQALRDSLLKEMANQPASCSSLSMTSLGEVVVAGHLKDAGTGGNVVGFLDPAFREKDAIPCGKDLLKGKGGELKTKQLFGRTAYYASGTPDDNAWITWTKAGVPILAGSEAWLTATLDPKAKKIAPAIADLATRADHGRMVWAAADITPERARGWGLPAGVVGTNVGVRVGVDLTDEIDVDVIMSFKTADEANRAATQLRSQIQQLRLTPAQPFLANVKLGVHGTDVRVMLHLDAGATAMLASLLKMR